MPLSSKAQKLNEAKMYIIKVNGMICGMIVIKHNLCIGINCCYCCFIDCGTGLVDILLHVIAELF